MLYLKNYGHACKEEGVGRTRKRRTPSIHQRPAIRTEEIRHHMALVSSSWSRTIGPRSQRLFPAHVTDVWVPDGEVGREHGGGEFAAVVAVACEGVDETWFRDGLRGVSFVRLSWVNDDLSFLPNSERVQKHCSSRERGGGERERERARIHDPR